MSTTPFDDECLAVGLLPAALPDAQRRFAVALAEGRATPDDPRGFLDGLNRDARHLFRPSKGGGAFTASAPASVEAPRVIRGPYEMAKAILDPKDGTATLRAIASGELRPGDSGRSPDVDLGAPPGWWEARRDKEARARILSGEGLPPVPTSDVLGQRVLEALKQDPTATATQIVRKLGVRRAAGLRAVKRARLALGTGEPDGQSRGAS